MTAMPEIRGLWHLALRVKNLPRSRAFYEEFFGMKEVWMPDPDNVYLSSGRDNLALHQLAPDQMADAQQTAGQSLDHLGFIVDSPETVDRLFQRVEQKKIPVVHRPRQHRDGSYSFYIADPDGNTVQVLFEPTISRLG